MMATKPQADDAATSSRRSEIQVPVTDVLLTRRKCAGPARRTSHIFEPLRDPERGPGNGAIEKIDKAPMSLGLLAGCT